MRILQNTASRRSGGTVAQVTFSDSGGFGALGASEKRGVPVFAPRGIAYRPCEGDNLLLLEADGSAVCAGVLAAADGLAEGELRLASAGGAAIHLKKNGDVVINGVTITKAGEIVASPQDLGALPQTPQTF